MKIFKLCKNNKKIFFSLLFVLSFLFCLYCWLNNLPLSPLLYIDIVILGISSIFNIYLFYPKRFKGEFSLKIFIKIFVKWLFYCFNIIVLSLIGLLWLNSLGWILQFRPLILWGLAAILLYLVLEIFGVLLNVNLVLMMILFSIATLVVLFMGTFSIKQWALISGILMLWNYINSEEFIIFLRNGKMKGVKIPSSLRYSWQFNKFLGYILTLLFYISLIIAPLIESWIAKNKELNDLFTKGIIRIYVFIGVIIVLGVPSIIILLIARSHKKSMVKKNINELIKLPNWKKFIATYQVLQRKNNKN
ncbi:Uncharacterised protein [Streptococcus macacae NCTC 11558]|uniref:Uncharacterized protein n=2 Tax=Streptococcus macacae TaxID=1339 RepID=G5JWS0_9STRE|nr:hypothetical protein STRMA_1206 [Streptococcus macacae NCTC 11558]SUN79030.1 Uncharacterised protein [Streptococcus macacae NCTC 11558]